MNLMSRLFGHNRPPSGAVAKERLKEVLVRDRVPVSYSELQRMRRDLIVAVSRHVDIDPERVELEFAHTGRDVHLNAHIPLRRSTTHPVGQMG